MEFGIIRPAMKIIHTSDWHLGARLHEEDRSAEHVAFLEWLLEQIKAERPDALLVAGDVFDTTAPSASAMKAYHSFVVRAYSEAGCRNIVITGGNHDSPSWLGMSRQILECVGATVVPAREDEPERECDDRTHDELVRAGFAEHCRRVVAAARAKAGDAPVVMMGHCVISGSRLSDDVSERQRGVVSDTVVGGVKSVDFDALPSVDYLALGHLHVPQRVAGRDVARYSGSPIPMSFSEAGAQKQILVVTLGEKSGDAVCVEERPIPCFHALARVVGAPEVVLARLEELACAGVPTYVEVSVSEGEGDLSPWWAKFATAVAGHPEIKILVERDRREKMAAGSGLEGLAEANENLSTLDELAVARARLSEENLTDEDRMAFEGLLAEVIAEVKSGLAEGE